MPIPTPFHPRAAALSESHEWRDWSGYLAAARYEPTHEHEYYAIRNAAALIDVSPLFKYELRGPHAQQMLNRLVTRDISRCVVGQIMYTPWCDDDGKVIDDGTVWRLAQDHFRITAAEPNLAWFQDVGYGLQVDVQDISEELAALALQGPLARQILHQVLDAAPSNPDLGHLKYYRFAKFSVSQAGRRSALPLTISRTGYTGDLGYELWLNPGHALALWDSLVRHGTGYGLTPAGMLALDMARIEAGMVMIQVDYISSRTALIPAQKSSPYEIGLGWTVDLDKPNFVGRKALLDEKRSGPAWKLVGLQVDWQAMQDLYARWDLVPQLAGRASRQAVPVYANSAPEAPQVGQMTSHTFSPLLKNYIGLASLERAHARYGALLSVEVTVEYTRQRVPARVVRLPFFNPARKRGMP
jgi:aminomethyltransferase